MPAIDLQKEVENLVVRARCGDQNAAGMITALRDRAKAGNAKAGKTMAEIHRFISANPVEKPPTIFGFEQVRDFTVLQNRGPVIGVDSLLNVLKNGNEDVFLVGCIILANGPPLSKEKINDIGATLPTNDERELFFFGIAHCSVRLLKGLAERGKAIMTAGKCVGFAHNIQRVRAGGPIALFSPAAAWELER